MGSTPSPIARPAGRAETLARWIVLATSIQACGGTSSAGEAGPPLDASTSPDTSIPSPSDAGTGGDDEASADASTNADADQEAAAPFAAPHGPLPLAVSSGGPVLAAPKLVIVTWKGDPLAAGYDDFANRLATDPVYEGYWGALSEYGVRPVASVVPVSIDETLPANLADSDIQTWLTQHLSEADAGADAGTPLPEPDSNTLYALFFPLGVTIGGSTFAAYHSDFTLPGGSIASYAVVSRYSNAGPDTITAYHELVEGVTDPQPFSAPAWLNANAAGFGWELTFGNELADLCEGPYFQPAGPFPLATIWSNAHAQRGDDPCPPGGTSPYFGAAPVLTDTIEVAGVAELGVKIPQGGSKTVELDLFSGGPLAPWTVQVFDAASALFGDAPQLSLALDKSQGQNGDKLHVTVTVLPPTAGQTLPGAPGPGYEAFVVQSNIGGAVSAANLYGQRHQWFVGVANQ